MNLKPILPIITLLFLFVIEINAQTDKTIKDFVSSIDSTLVALSEKTSEMDILQRNRKMRMRGRFENGTRIFKQKIKHYKGGTKKEKIKVRYLAPHKAVTVLKILLINDAYYYIKKQTYSSDHRMVVKEEEFVDGKIYRKIEYNYKHKKINRVDLWIMKRN